MSLTQQSSNDITDASPTHLGDTPFVGKAQAMKAIALSLIAALALGGSALAAERVKPAPAEHCETLDKLKAVLKSAKFTALDAGQTHFIEGVYLATPPVSGMPDADGAFLVEGKEGSLIVWMRGKCASPTQPTIVGPALIQVLRSISALPGEKIAPAESKDELKL